MADIKFEIVESIGVLSEKANGWKKELNKVAWNDKPAKYDIREWDAEHQKMGKGVTLSDEQPPHARDFSHELGGFSLA